MVGIELLLVVVVWCLQACTSYQHTAAALGFI
jgi:hypothetical protein